MSRLPAARPPTPPGEILLHDFIEPLGLSQSEVAAAIGVPFQRLNAVIRGRRALTPSTALRLARYFGTSAGVWTDLQAKVDLHATLVAEGEAIAAIEPLAA
ncbi:HigA family addiction module antitoxin [Rubrivirga sp.]|uniref:HigA family addiction module antitoxin n=1 Tax=Rubrivirga sp. TaxID=1885344 RepID=UPI003B5229F4